ncbi:MAG: hypothetical protein AUG51_06235 [Acidobacteria bacterium 13_1_20CM_3_53_8]|nr:MAG: hypothetical protein AUG51_06235 [Acidobacteria bacterium 13_1_20CM_3_53_8]
MLTADLAQSWRRGERTGPRYIDREDPEYLGDALQLIRIFAEYEGRARHELTSALDDYVGVGTDYKILRGMIKLLLDRCAFQTASPVDPIEIRRSLFLKTKEHHPHQTDETVRAELMHTVALELGHAPEILSQAIYADLPENQKLVEFNPLTERELLNLFNLAQAQALLYHCVEMQLDVEPQAAENYRELFNAIKAYRLIHTITGSPSEGYKIRLDGPVSMFHRSQKYGVQMAVFLPALLLCKGWHMRAEIAQTKQNAPSAYFEMDSQQKRLSSHYVDEEQDENPVMKKFIENWAKLETAWTLARSSEVIDLGESTFIPDFVLRNEDGHRVYLEILGFWTPQHLQKRLKEFEHAGVKNFLLAAWDELRGSRDPLSRVPVNTIIFKTKLEPITVELAANEIVFGKQE